MVSVWSPPTVCTTLARCEEQCKGCEPGSCTADAAGACQALGDLRLRDEMGQFDVALAARSFERACEGGRALACSSLAIQVQDGRGVARDIPRAISLYERSCAGGMGVGCYNLGLMYRHGSAGQIDEGKAAGFFQQAREKYEAQCDKGDLQWCMNLGVLYENGHGVAPEPARAQSIYERACAKGHGDSCVNLALAKLATATPDTTAQLQLLERYCNAGTVLACGVLGQVYAKGGPGVPQNPQQAATLLERACTGGSGHACATIGALRAIGQMVPRDAAAASRLSKRACELGLASSCAALGIEAARAEAWEEAHQYLQQACWIGDGESCARLALMVKDGKGCKPDPQRANELSRDACRMGQGVSCMDLLKRKEPIPLPPSRRQQLLEEACKHKFAEACAELGI